LFWGFYSPFTSLFQSRFINWKLSLAMETGGCCICL
jgi:hypothetical protein